MVRSKRAVNGRSKRLRRVSRRPRTRTRSKRNSRRIRRSRKVRRKDSKRTRMNRRRRGGSEPEPEPECAAPTVTALPDPLLLRVLDLLPTPSLESFSVTSRHHRGLAEPLLQARNQLVKLCERRSWNRTRHDFEEIDHLLAGGTNPDTITSPTFHGTPLLTLASSLGDIELVRKLLEYNADCDTMDTENFMTPLMMAAKNNKPKVVEALLNAEADPNRSVGPEGMTPLILSAKSVSEFRAERRIGCHEAARQRWSEGHMKIVRDLMAARADRTRQVTCGPHAGKTALNFAKEAVTRGVSGAQDIVRMLEGDLV